MYNITDQDEMVEGAERLGEYQRAEAARFGGHNPGTVAARLGAP